MRKINWFDSYHDLQIEFARESGVVCPICGDDYVAPTSVSVNAGGVTTIIDDDKEVKPSIKINPTGRGVSINISYTCERGHTWVEKQQFHKGQTFKETLLIDCESVRGPIWRD